jgi:hypothetical protein
MTYRSAGLLASLLLMGGCATQSTLSPQTTTTGSDRDMHGCIASAGYTWCERTQDCERPWILAEEEGFNNTSLEFSAYCSD